MRPVWRVLVGCVVAAIGAVTLAVPAAHAAPAQQPIYADVNGDGVTDRTILPVQGSPDPTCGVSVALGTGRGGYGPARWYHYRLPGWNAPVSSCPDSGEYDLGGDGTLELLVNWYNGPEDSLGYNLVVLRDYRPVAKYRAVRRVGGNFKADFNGDGLQDLYIVTDDPDGFQSYLNTPSGRLVRGPSHWGGVRGHATADFDGDGGTDIVLEYLEGDRPPYEGVVVVFGDGTTAQLADNTTYGWKIRIIDANRDGRLDVELRNPYAVLVHINRGDQSFVPAPVANSDVFSASRAGPNVFAVRANDHANWNASLSIVTQPRYGRLTRSASGAELVYQRTATHRLTDSFSYRLSQNGRSDDANVTVTMRD
ncbi:FG-GAP repeat domain-containing protein [Plantactinospora solaniradicis]|uniref:FG-GAP repeat domain-containing protein n=1 Tax=Plantactinospora solaniradicis TaxID=1723736 RepID=A0ABW1KJ32_9ACTN